MSFAFRTVCSTLPLYLALYELLLIHICPNLSLINTVLHLPL